MDTWEYITVYIRLQVKKTRLKKKYEWSVELDEDTVLTGMAEVLDYFGKKGWELVTVMDEYRSGNAVSSQVEVYRAFFKRKLKDETPAGS